MFVYLVIISVSVSVNVESFTRSGVYNCFIHSYHFHSLFLCSCWRLLNLDPLILGTNGTLSYTNGYKKCFVWNGDLKKKQRKKEILSLWKMEAVPTYDLFSGQMVNMLHLTYLTYSPETMWCSTMY